HSDYPSLAEMKETSSLERLSGRIVVSDLPKAKGGEFPKLRYLTTLAKNIVEAERWGEIFQEFAKRPNFGKRVANSLRGHEGEEPLCAHFMFENKNQRILVERIKEMSEKIAQQAETEQEKRLPLSTLASRLRVLADFYHLPMTLADGTFIPCSAWTWASHSFKGGSGLPTAHSLHVERDWTSRDFLVECLKLKGISEEQLDKRIIELMGEGRESEDLAESMLGLTKEQKKLFVEQSRRYAEEPKAGKLKRLGDGPILEPIKEHYWESKYVLNTAAFKLGGNIYLIYRAYGDDNTSRLGLAILSSDGRHVVKRLDKPIFEPTTNYEGAERTDPELSRGCEDPRITIIDGKIYMLYTAFDGNIAQIALASISINDFMAGNWNAWERHGPAYPGVPNKDAALFPEKINGKFAVHHRIDPNMWLSYLDSLECPWPKEGYEIVMGPRSGMLWDAEKIGAGGPSIKTKFGWLHIY
ncbi:unnamed protein product, partial [marine sediment metagenome]